MSKVQRNVPKREPGLADICPICVFLLENEEGEILFEQNMIADIYMNGKIIVSVGWHCQMCGASGVGNIPHFHEKPRKGCK